MARRVTWRSIVPVLVLAMMAAACTSSVPDEGSAASTESAAESVGSPAGDDSSGDTSDEAPASTGRGALVYAVETSTIDPFAHYAASCRLTCRLVLEAVADPLFLPGVDGTPVPVLLAGAEPDEDFTVWRLETREGIRFHDGTVVDAAAVAFNLEVCRSAPLTAPTFADVAEISVDGDVVVVRMVGPWSAFPAALAGSSCSFVLSPTWLSSLSDLPQRDRSSPAFDPEIAAIAADGDPTAVVGSGPFVFDRFDRGDGNALRVVRNDAYWRGTDGVTGEGLPLLDTVEFVAVTNDADRVRGLLDGVFSVAHTDDGPSRVALAASELRVHDALVGADTDQVVFNAAAGLNASAAAVLGSEESLEMDPEGVQAANPFVHLPCRRALAHATDTDALVDERHGGGAIVANGPFPPGVAGHLDDSGAASFNPDEALVDLEACLVEAGTDRLSFTLLVPEGTPAAATGEALVSMWVARFGASIEVRLDPVPVEGYLRRGLEGSFQAMITRHPGAVDLDAHQTAWSIRTASPIGRLALNPGRFLDPVIDQSLAIQRRTDEADLRRSLAEEVNRSFAANVWHLFLVWRPWSVAHADAVVGLDTPVAPDGTPLMALAGGQHRFAQIFCVDGRCG